MATLRSWPALLLLLLWPHPASGSTPTGQKRAAAAVNEMMTAYNESSGLWDAWNISTTWWQSGVALQAIVDYMDVTGSRDYLTEAHNTVELQRAPLPWWPAGDGDFRADSTDDTGWWALAVASLYALTGEESLLNIAKEDEAYMYSYWSVDCSGGIIWNIPSKTYKNAISNELYLELTATLHNLNPSETKYLNRSLTQWNWFKNSGMINAEWLVNDGLTTDGTCVNNGQETWTYNQGVILGGLAELYKATGDKSYLGTAERIANAVLASSLLSPNGILTEPCSDSPCDFNSEAFKGIFMRNLAKLNLQLSNRPYSSYISNNAASMYSKARPANGSDIYGMKWQGPFDTASLGRQESAVMLLTAALST